MKCVSTVATAALMSMALSVSPAAGQATRQPAPAQRTAPTVRVTGQVKDQVNGIALPGVPVEVVGRTEVVYTDVDGRYSLDLPPGTYTLKVALDGYQAREVAAEVSTARNATFDVGLTMSSFAESVTVTADLVNVETSTAEAQLIVRKQSPVIIDNLGAQEMRNNGDSDAATAMTRVTGLSLVDNQYVFVRGLGERYSNTTLAGSVLPTTEPDKKVVPLDLFPTGLIDSVQVSKSYSPDRSAEFAGGLVQVVPIRQPQRPVFDLTYGLSAITTSTGKSIPLSPLGQRDWLGYDNGARSLPSGIPENKIVRRGIFTPTVGYSTDEINGFGRLFENVWSPRTASGRPGQNWSATVGNRVGKFGVIASATHQYREQFVDEERRFFRIADGTDLEPVSDYRIQTGTQRAQLGLVGNVSYQFSPNQRVSSENFYTHSGRDEGRVFEGPNFENALDFRDYRLQFIEEGLFSTTLSGEHFFQNLSSSRIDWRASVARANRDEPDLREVLYERALNSAATVPYILADESQSGFRMFNVLDDNTVDVAGNWSIFTTAGNRPTQYKFGASHIERSRDFRSRRFRYIPIVLNTGGAVSTTLRQSEPEAIFASSNVGTTFRFNEETRPVDAYNGDQQTTAGFGMVDLALSARTRIVGGARVERFNQEVNTFDPFGLFERTIQARNNNTDIFPGVNLVQTVSANSNVRLSYSTTVNRPEFRELAEFEFTDVVGNRAVKGNPRLRRALIQNVDARWERFTGGRGVVAASFFFKYFDQPIERVVIAAANPIVTFQNSDRARNVGLELEASRQLGSIFYVNLNYTFVDSKISLLPEQRAVQTSLERPLAGQSKNLFNVSGEVAKNGFSTRVLLNYFGDRISDVGANQAPDIIEQGRATIDVVVSQRVRGMNLRFSVDNVTDVDYRFTQGGAPTPQRLFNMGRTIAVSFGYNLF